MRTEVMTDACVSRQREHREEFPRIDRRTTTKVLLACATLFQGGKLKAADEPMPSTRFVEAVKRQPTATIEILKALPPDNPLVSFFISPEGQPWVATPRYLQSEGFLERLKNERKEAIDDPPDLENLEGYKGRSGSGFLALWEGAGFVVTNDHLVIDAIDWRIRTTTHRDDGKDIAVIPGEQVANPANELPFRTVHPTCTSDDLTKLLLQICGVGSEIIRLSGTPMLLEECPDGEPDCSSCPGMLAFVIKDPAFDPRKLRGMSGSPVIDPQSKSVVGIFHSYYESDEGILAAFSGPEHLRHSLQRGAGKRRAKILHEPPVHRVTQQQAETLSPAPVPLAGELTPFSLP